MIAGGLGYPAVVGYMEEVMSTKMKCFGKVGFSEKPIPKGGNHEY